MSTFCEKLKCKQCPLVKDSTLCLINANDRRIFNELLNALNIIEFYGEYY